MVGINDKSIAKKWVNDLSVWKLRRVKIHSNPNLCSLLSSLSFLENMWLAQSWWNSSNNAVFFPGEAVHGSFKCSDITIINLRASHMGRMKFWATFQKHTPRMKLLNRATKAPHTMHRHISNGDIIRASGATLLQGTPNLPCTLTVSTAESSCKTLQESISFSMIFYCSLKKDAAICTLEGQDLILAGLLNRESLFYWSCFRDKSTSQSSWHKATKILFEELLSCA